MPDWIYCGSEGAASALNTQALLQNHAAIWCQPPGLARWPARRPQPDERLWLVYRVANLHETVLLLGGGRVVQAPRMLFRTNLLWTNSDVPGLRDAAIQLGYRGPTSMAFLRLNHIVFPNGQPQVQGLAGIRSGLNNASPEQIANLSVIVPIH